MNALGRIEMNGRIGVCDEQISTDGSDDKITSLRLRQLIESQNYTCKLTGRTLSPADAALDHVVPITKGGQNDMTNVQIVHKDVNRAKGTMTQNDFLKMCREVVAHAAD